MFRIQTLSLRKLITYTITTTLAILTICTTFLSLTKFQPILNSSNIFDIIIATLLSLLVIPLTVIRLYFLIRDCGINMSIKDLVKVSTAQTYASLVIPGFYVGGEMITIAYLIKNGLDFKRSVEIITLRYVIDTLTLCLITILLIFVLNVPILIVLILSGIYFTIYTFLYLLVTKGIFGKFMSKLVGKVISKSKLISRILEGTGFSITLFLNFEERPLKLSLKTHVILFLASFLQIFTLGLAVLFICYSIGLNIDLNRAILIQAAYTILTFVSIFPCALGLGELANFYTLLTLGLERMYMSFNAIFRLAIHVLPISILAYPSSKFINKEILS